MIPERQAVRSQARGVQHDCTSKFPPSRRSAPARPCARGTSPAGPARPPAAAAPPTAWRRAVRRRAAPESAFGCTCPRMRSSSPLTTSTGALAGAATVSHSSFTSKVYTAHTSEDGGHSFLACARPGSLGDGAARGMGPRGGAPTAEPARRGGARGRAAPRGGRLRALPAAARHVLQRGDVAGAGRDGLHQPQNDASYYAPGQILRYRLRGYGRGAAGVLGPQQYVVAHWAHERGVARMGSA